MLLCCVADVRCPASVKKAHCGGPPRRSGTPTLTWRERSHSCTLGEVHLNTLKQKKKLLAFHSNIWNPLSLYFDGTSRALWELLSAKTKVFFFLLLFYSVINCRYIIIKYVFIIKKNMLSNNILKSAQTLSVVLFFLIRFFPLYAFWCITQVKLYSTTNITSLFWSIYVLIYYVNRWQYGPFK